MMGADELREFNKSIIDEFRANEGVLGGMFEGAPVLLLSSVGAKSGESRLNPLVYLSDGDRVIIFASYEGQPKNPPGITIFSPIPKSVWKSVQNNTEPAQRCWTNLSALNSMQKWKKPCLCLQTIKTRPRV